MQNKDLQSQISGFQSVVAQLQREIKNYQDSMCYLNRELEKAAQHINEFESFKFKY